MLKFLPVLIIVLGVGGFLIYKTHFENTNPVRFASSTSEQPPTNSALESRVRELEFTVTDLLGKSKPNSSSKPVSSSLDSRVTTLENTIANLQTRISNLESGSNSSTSTSVSRSPVYIPLGWTGSTQNTDWTSITGQEISINPAEYSGYKSMQLEISLRVYQGNGTAYARLQNVEDGTTILASEVSTDLQDYTWISSSSFNISSTTKTYRLQLKTSTSYSADVANARIKVNF